VATENARSSSPVEDGACRLQSCRMSRRGSFSTRVFVSKIIVARVAASYEGQ
jgi:hypothetical protein